MIHTTLYIVKNYYQAIEAIDRSRCCKHLALQELKNHSEFVRGEHLEPCRGN